MTVSRMLLITVPLALGSLACSDPAGVARLENVRVRATESAVVIENRRSEPIVYTVLDAGFAARALWGPCVDANCPNIPPNESRRVPAEEIGGWGESDQVIAYWWHVYASADSGFYRDSIRAMPVRYR